MVKKQMKTLSKELFGLINEHHKIMVKEKQLDRSIDDKLCEIDDRIIEKYGLKVSDKPIDYCANMCGDFCLSYVGNLSIKQINEIRTLLNCTDYEDVSDEMGFFHRYYFYFDWEVMYKKDFSTGDFKGGEKI